MKRHVKYRFLFECSNCDSFSNLTNSNKSLMFDSKSQLNCLSKLVFRRFLLPAQQNVFRNLHSLSPFLFFFIFTFVAKSFAPLSSSFSGFGLRTPRQAAATFCRAFIVAHHLHLQPGWSIDLSRILFDRTTFLILSALTVMLVGPISFSFSQPQFTDSWTVDRLCLFPSFVFVLSISVRHYHV